jgi:glycosyltransferase involved in cell wall biosynthesis
MDSQPLVSVLMTVFNREAYLSEAIESVLNSSYRNFEFIIVDDFSTDRSYEIAEEYSRIDNRIRLFKNESNLGDYSNRNKAASFANGKYIKYLDSDDIIYFHGLEIMVKSMESFPQAAMGFPWNRFSGDKKLPYILTSESAYENHFFCKGLLVIGPSGSIYRSDIFNASGKFKLEFGVATDLAFNLEIAQKYPVVVFARDLFWWRPHPNQEYNLKQMDYINLNFRIHSIYLLHPDNPIRGEKAYIALNDQKNLLSRRILYRLYKGNFKEAWEIFNRAKLSPVVLFLSLFPSKIRRLLQK